MPRVSEDYLERRRDEILDGAQRAFARHGYEGATVARLEEETGLSRGAIFHHFHDKLDLFVALAARDAAAIADLLRAEGLVGAMRRMVDEDPDWLVVYLSIGSRYRTDPDFRRRWEERGRPLDEALRDVLRRDRERGTVRTDVDEDVLMRFVGVVWDGVLLQRAAAGDVPHLEAAIDLVDDVLAPRYG